MKPIKCKNYSIYFNDWSAITDYIERVAPSSTFILVDENTEKYCLHHLLEHVTGICHVIRIPSGELNKTIETCQYVWSQLLRYGADRYSLMINLGGGVIGDLGGFCAATYMRGIRFIQVPTTLLSQVDASVGGKLGVDLLGFKNMIGLIQDPEMILIHTPFLRTLPDAQIRSGYAELLKHGLIADKESWQTLSKASNINTLNYDLLVYDSVTTKKSVTEQDPQERGLRKILNFGHTIGHAIESYWLDSKTPLLHGDAVAIGMVSEAYLSYRVGNITESELFDIRYSLIDLYGHHPKYVKPVKELMTLMAADKKNQNGNIKFALLQEVGHACFDVQVQQDLIEDSFTFYREKV
jgi:3-dehydroquinate synthase